MTNQTPASEPQSFDLLLTGGRLIDPRHGHDGIADIGIAAGRIAAVGPDLPRGGAGHIEDVSGLLVVPGLIDLHTHVYHKATSLGVDPNPSRGVPPFRRWLTQARPEPAISQGCGTS